jgi:hypothetical protein
MEKGVGTVCRAGGSLLNIRETIYQNIHKDATLQRKSDLCAPRKETARPLFQIHVSVSDLYIPTIGPPIFPAAE